MWPRVRALLLGSALGLASLGAAAQERGSWLGESWVRVPVTLTLANGARHHSLMQITRFKPDGAGPFPLVIINHGRSAESRDSPPRQRMSHLASYFVRRGFAVMVPTRIGYGESAFEADPEHAGQCNDRAYFTALRPAVEQIAATLTYARSLDWVDARQHWVVGQSVGGIASVAYAATAPEGLVAYLNFSGGAGGNPSSRPGEPCQPERLAGVFEDTGRRSRTPGLWLYAENDRYFGPHHVRHWFARYRLGNPDTQLEMLPPIGDDGHSLALSAGPLWRPLADRFLARFHIAPPQSPGGPAASGFARLDDSAAIPWINTHMRSAQYPAFLASDKPRAFAIARDGSIGWVSSPREPAAQALAFCQRKTSLPCMLYALDDNVVWAPASTP